MSKEVQKLKHSLGMSMVWILLILLIVTGSTYAWFTFAGRASTNVTPMGGSIGSGKSSLLISNHQSGPFDKTCELQLIGNPDTLKPLSTADLNQFFTAKAQDNQGITVLYRSADSEVDQSALHGTVYLQCLNAPCEVYFNKEELNLGNDVQVLAAMRLGLKITSHTGTQNFIFQLDDLGATGNAQSVRTISRASAVVSSIASSGKASYVDDPALKIGAYMAQAGAYENEYDPGSTSLCALDKDEVATVEYWLYLEGCDEQCSNPVQNKATEIRLAFAGVDAEEKQQ